MIFGKNGGAPSLCAVLLFASVFCAAATMQASPPAVSTKPVAAKRTTLQDDSFVSTPAADLALQPENARKANALADFVEGLRLEENAEMENALSVYERVLNVDPGLSELALRVAALLSQQADYPHAIDVLKDAIKAKPKEPRPSPILAVT